MMKARNINKVLLGLLAASGIWGGAVCNAVAAEVPELLAEDTAKVEGKNIEGSLSDYIKQGENATANESKETGNTWISSLVDKVAETASKSTGSENVTPVKRSNASVFDIAGVMLRMDKMQVSEALQRRGYQKTYEHME
ncbi:MAG: hypothetical protein ILA52_01855, partial [Alphaproteobacteria bacterium]|nr:hypothetical protein [Alphaproteobacteria bacterium]